MIGSNAISRVAISFIRRVVHGGGGFDFSDCAIAIVPKEETYAVVPYESASLTVPHEATEISIPYESTETSVFC